MIDRFKKKMRLFNPVVTCCLRILYIHIMIYVHVPIGKGTMIMGGDDN